MNTYFEKAFGKMLKDGIECIVMEMSMFLPTVMVEVDEILNVVVRTDVFNVLH